MNSKEEYVKWLHDKSELEAVLEEDAAWRYIKMTIDTRDVNLSNAYTFFVTKIQPELAPFEDKLNKKLVDSPYFESLNKEELSKDLGKAGLETLSIIIYQGPISRAEIDYIRGVNSQFILRNLLIKGLIDRVDNPTDQRSFLYKPSLELFSFLGISKIEDIPDFESVKADILAFKNNDEQIKN